MMIVSTIKDPKISFKTILVIILISLGIALYTAPLLDRPESAGFIYEPANPIHLILIIVTSFIMFLISTHKVSIYD